MPGGNGQAKCSVCGKDIPSAGMCSDCKAATDKLLKDLKKKPPKDDNGKKGGGKK